MIWGWFVLGAIICWGAYGPMLHKGQMALGNSSVRALLLVGVAYFLVAVLVPSAILAVSGDKGAFNPAGSMTAIFAGILGAGGAVCILLANRNGGTPLIVMPLVFGFAPIINSVVSMIQHPPDHMPDPYKFAGYLLGICMTGGGAWLVLHNKP